MLLVHALMLAAVSSGAEAPDAITFTKYVAPIFAKSFMTCHRPGEIETGDSGFVVATRRHRFSFTNADEYRAELEGMVGQDVEITGLWRVDRIEIQKIALRPPD